MTRWARLWRRTTRLFGVDAVPVTVVDDLAPDPSGWSAGYADTAETGYRTVARRLPLLIVISLRLAAEASKARCGGTDVACRDRVRACGVVGYRCLGDPWEAARVAGAAVVARDWNRLRACGTIELTVHGLAFLGGVHGVAAELLAAGDTRVSPAVAERIAVLARDAQPWERQQAATDLAATGDSSIAGLLPTR